MPPSVTVVIDPFGEYPRPAEAEVPFERTLRSLLSQSYPPDRTTILVTCTSREAPSVRRIIADEPRARVVDVPEGNGYYQKKNQGMREATTDIVMLADGDVAYPPEWIAEMVAAFERGGEKVVYVQGVSRFAPGRYSDILSPMYFRNFLPEGPTPQVISSHNVAIRTRDVPEFQFEETTLRGGTERPLSERITGAGRTIWHNRRATVRHEPVSDLHELRMQADDRGYYRMIMWRRTPNRADRALRPLGYLAIPIYVAYVALRDAGRQLRDRPARGLTGAGLLKIPGYIAVTFAFHVVAGLSMLRVLRHYKRTGEFPPAPHGDVEGPLDLGRPKPAAASPDSTSANAPKAS
jgi:hypothetical protein